jgi:hypothetical protein
LRSFPEEALEKKVGDVEDQKTGQNDIVKKVDHGTRVK